MLPAGIPAGTCAIEAALVEPGLGVTLSRLECLPFHEVAQEMLCCAGDEEDADMLGRLLVATVTGLVAWKYRDALTEYMKGNAGACQGKG